MDDRSPVWLTIRVPAPPPGLTADHVASLLVLYSYQLLEGRSLSVDGLALERKFSREKSKGHLRFLIAFGLIRRDVTGDAYKFADAPRAVPYKR
jgi:hypothetical protein